MSGKSGTHPVDGHVGGRLRALRVARGLSQGDLAGALGLTFQQIQKYETGRNRISASKLWDSAEFLGVDVGYFYHGLEAPDAEAAGRSASADGLNHPASVALMRWASRLSPRQQRLALRLLKEVAAAPAASARP